MVCVHVHHCNPPSPCLVTHSPWAKPRRCLEVMALLWQQEERVLGNKFVYYWCLCCSKCLVDIWTDHQAAVPSQSEVMTRAEKAHQQLQPDGMSPYLTQQQMGRDLIVLLEQILISFKTHLCRLWTGTWWLISVLAIANSNAREVAEFFANKG